MGDPRDNHGKNKKRNKRKKGNGNNGGHSKLTFCTHCDERTHTGKKRICAKCGKPKPQSSF